MHTCRCRCMLLALFSVSLSSAIPKARITLTEKGIYPANPQRHDTAVAKAQSKLFARPESLEGWLTEPKLKPSKALFTKDTSAEDKSGYCGHPRSFGIQCGSRMDQCKADRDCPDITKCCLVSDCGLLCVKPQEKVKYSKFLKKKSKEEEIEESEPSATTAEGLKIEDITNMS